MSVLQHNITDDACWITFDDGKVNAFSLAALTELNDMLTSLGQQNLPVVIQGRPGIFSAGFDMKELAGPRHQQIELLSAGIDLIVALLSFPQPILTLCTGHAYPMGAFVLLSSDYRIAADGDWRIGLNEVAIKMTVPPFALALAEHRLTRPGFARISTASMFDPQAASTHGYVDEVTLADNLQSRALQMVKQWATLDGPSYAATKQAMNTAVIQRVLAAKAMFLPTAA